MENVLNFQKTYVHLYGKTGIRPGIKRRILLF
ncbi:hypothetical protein [Chryseobacterium elymi]